MTTYRDIECVLNERCWWRPQIAGTGAILAKVNHDY